MLNIKFTLVLLVRSGRRGFQMRVGCHCESSANSRRNEETSGIRTPDLLQTEGIWNRMRASQLFARVKVVLREREMRVGAADRLPGRASIEQPGKPTLPRPSHRTTRAKKMTGGGGVKKMTGGAGRPTGHSAGLWGAAFTKLTCEGRSSVLNNRRRVPLKPNT